MADQGDVEVVVEETRDSMEKALRSLRHELQKVRTGRANVALLDGISADYYGAQTPLSQMANLTAPDPRLIVVSPWDASSIAAIEKAIQASDLGLTPQSDGKLVRIPIPPLTEERRKQLVKHVHKMSEDHKVGVRDARRAGRALLKELERDGLAADDRHRADKQVQDLTDDFVKNVEDQIAQKEKEILEV
jgi:ribosome recycling factor